MARPSDTKAAHVLKQHFFCRKKDADLSVGVGPGFTSAADKFVLCIPKNRAFYFLKIVVFFELRLFNLALAAVALCASRASRASRGRRKARRCPGHRVSLWRTP